MENHSKRNKTSRRYLFRSTNNRLKKITKLTPVDKEWRWTIIIGIALLNIFSQPMLSIFSLLYGDALQAMGHNTQGAAFVLNTVLCVTHFVGPIAGALIKLTTCRFVAVAGAMFSTTGILLSGFCTNIWHLILTYGILLGFGLGLLQNTSFVTVNSYFTTKKSLAVGFATAGIALGQILMPHIVLYLLVNFGFKGACIILALISLHGIIGTILIQPIKCHKKKAKVEVVDYYKMHLSENNRNYENESKQTLMKKAYDLLDISLLSRPRFLMVIVGNALIVVSIQNFSMLYPFFLQYQASMDKQQTAYCMSTVALADVIGRLTLPILQEIYHIKARMMLVWTSVWLIVSRQILVYQTNLYVLLAMSALYGFGRSMAIVVRNIALSEQCEINQVPSAVGLGMLSVSIIVPPTGYFLGWIRDYTDSYIVCITAQNLLLVLLLILWIPDMIFLFRKEKRKKKKKSLMQFYNKEEVTFKSDMKIY